MKQIALTPVLVIALTGAAFAQTAICANAIAGINHAVASDAEDGLSALTRQNDRFGKAVELIRTAQTLPDWHWDEACGTAAAPDMIASGN